MSKQNSTLIKEQNYNEERIKEIVKASYLLSNTKPEKNSNENKSDNKILSPLFNQYPDLETYASTGKIIDIQFDNKFESDLSNKNIIELSDNNTLPEYIELTIQPKTGEDTFTKKIDITEKRELFNHLVRNYGNGHLDSLIGEHIILKPNTKYNKKYDISIPNNTATSKLKTKIIKLFSDKFKRGEKYCRTKFFIGNGIRTLINISQISLLYVIYYAMFQFTKPDHLSRVEYNELFFVSSLFIVIGIILLSRISMYLNTKIKGGNNFIGAFEYTIFTCIKSLYNYISKQVFKLNKKFGKLININ